MSISRKDTSAVNVGGTTPEELLFEACYNNQVEDVKRLLEQYPALKVNKLMPNGWGALHHPSMKDHISIVKLLLQHPAIDVNITTLWGGTPFSLACSSGSTSIVKELLSDQRVEVNEQDKYGATPLWKAGHEGNLDVVKWILASGRKVDLNAKDKNWGFTALETARNRSVEEIGRNRNTQSAIGLEVRRKNCPLIVNLLERFKNNPDQTIAELRKELGITDFLVSAPNNNRASFLFFLQSFNVIPKDIFITVQPPPTYNPPNALVQLGINTSQTVSFLKEKIQDITGIPMTQQKISSEAGTESLVGDHSKLLTFNIIEGARLVLHTDYVQQEASLDLIPRAIKDQFNGFLGDVEVASFLTMASISPSLQTLTLQKLQQMSTEQFLRWARDSGTHFRHYYGKPVEFVIITPQRVEGVRIMLQRLSKEVGVVAASGKSKFRKELSSHAVNPFNKDLETQQTEVQEIYGKRKYIKRSAKTVAPEELLAVRLYTLPKFEIQPLFSQAIDSYVRDVEEEGTLRLRAEDRDKEKEKEKGEKGEKDTWKHAMNHLCKATADLRGIQGTMYRAHPAITGDLEQLKPGNVVVFPTFTVCLTHLDAARKMSDNKVLFEITVNREFGCLVKDYSYYRIEHEVLLPPFSTFRVSSVERDYLGSVLHIRLECCFVPPAITPLLPPIQQLTPEEEKNRLRTEFFVAIMEGNAFYFLHNKKIPTEFAKEKNERGQTPLHVAARQPGSEYVMVWLLATGADVNATDLNGSTPLHLSIAAKQKSLSKILIQRGALLDARNSAGKVPKDENPEFFANIMSKLKKEKIEEPVIAEVQRRKSKSQEFDFQEPLSSRKQLAASFSELPVASSPTFEAVEMRSQCLKQVAALEKAEMITKAQAKVARMKVMKEDVNIMAACQAYNNDLQLLAETLVEYLEIS